MFASVVKQTNCYKIGLKKKKINETSEIDIFVKAINIVTQIDLQHRCHGLLAL